MGTIAKLYDNAYVAGDVTMAVAKGELIVFCVHWTWNGGNSYYAYTSGALYVNSVSIPGYSQYIAANGDGDGDLMYIFPYLATATGNITVSLSPTDTIAQERYIRLTAIKITPTTGYLFEAGSYFIAAGYRGRDSSVGNKPISVSNIAGDYLIGLSESQNPNGTLQIAWTSPATEQFDAYVNGYIEPTVATQVSDTTNDVFSYYQSGGYYNGGVAIAVRETLAYGGQVIIWDD